METRKCLVCNHIVEGFTNKDVEHRLIMHMMKHKLKKEEEEISNVEGNN